MIPFFASLKILEEEYPFQPGMSLSSIRTGLDMMDSMQVHPLQSESEVERAMGNAVKDGLLLEIPPHIGSADTLYKSTDDVHDLLLWFGGRHSFDDLLLSAGQDSRFDDLFKNNARTS